MTRGPARPKPAAGPVRPETSSGARLLAARGPLRRGEGAPVRGAPGSAALALASCVLLCPPASPAEPPAEERPVSPAPQADPADLGETELFARLRGLEDHVSRLEKKLDGIERLLRRIHAGRLRRLETVFADPELERAARALERRYGVPGVAEAFVSVEPEALAGLRRRLAQALARRAAPERAAFAADAELARILGAMAAPGRGPAGEPHVLVGSIAGRDAEAAGALVLSLLELGTDAAREAALWGAFRAEADGLAEALSARAEALSRKPGAEPGLRALADAAAAAHGDRGAELRLAEEVAAGALDPRAASRLAWRLRSCGEKVAFRIYAELVGEQEHGFAAAQAFSQISGYGRRVGPRDIRERRDELQAEMRGWLERNYERLRYDPRSRRFTVRPPE